MFWYYLGDCLAVSISGMIIPMSKSSALNGFFKVLSFWFDANYDFLIGPIFPFIVGPDPIACYLFILLSFFTF